VAGKRNIILALSSAGLILLLALFHGFRVYHVHIVTRVFDGDTIQIDDGRIVRLIGVDAPEVQSPFSNDEPFGKESRNYLAALILHQKVLIEPGEPPLDRFKRTLAYVYLDDILLNGRIIRDGWALSCRQFDYPWRDLFLSYENEARSKGLGLWNRKENRDGNPDAE
jgi:micrococcal nuclease